MTREERAWLEVSRRRIEISAPTPTQGRRLSKCPASWCPDDARWQARSQDGSLIGFGASPLLAVENALNPQAAPVDVLEERDPRGSPEWSRVFRDVLDFLADGGRPPPWSSWVEAWAVAGILYEEFSTSAIPDAAYDAICRYMLDWRPLQGAEEWIEEQDLVAGTAMNSARYPEQHRRVARAMIGEGEPSGSSE